MNMRDKRRNQYGRNMSNVLKKQIAMKKDLFKINQIEIGTSDLKGLFVQQNML